MRELKFLYVYEHNETKEKIKMPFDLSWDIEHMSEFFSQKNLKENYTLVSKLQATGYIDANNKEIYEGDILKNISRVTDGPIIKNNTGIWIVTFKNGAFVLDHPGIENNTTVVRERLSSLFDKNMNISNTIEIVGNSQYNISYLEKEAS